jgi:hypothetical protein
MANQNRFKKDIPFREGWDNVNEELLQKIRDNNVRSERITFVLTPKEKEKMKEDALKAGYINNSDYIRKRLKL